jgi:hypothetical protein
MAVWLSTAKAGLTGSRRRSAFAMKRFDLWFAVSAVWLLALIGFTLLWLVGFR